MNAKPHAFLSVYDTEKTKEFLMFARRLIEGGWVIVSSGGTATFLENDHVPVTYVEAITGLGSMFGGRVKTIHPNITSGMIASRDMSAELAERQFIWFDLAYVTFYPLGAELRREGATFESCIKNLDVGGPMGIQAMCKGGDRIVIVEPAQLAEVTAWLDEDCPNPEEFKFMLEAKALRVCAEYAALAASIRDKFKPKSLAG